MDCLFLFWISSEGCKSTAESYWDKRMGQAEWGPEGLTQSLIKLAYEKASWQKGGLGRLTSPSCMPTKTNWGTGPDGEAYGCFSTKMHTSMWRVQMLSHMSHGVVWRTTCNRACVEKLMLSSGYALCHKKLPCVPHSRLCHWRPLLCPLPALEVCPSLVSSRLLLSVCRVSLPQFWGTRTW